MSGQFGKGEGVYQRPYDGDLYTYSVNTQTGQPRIYPFPDETSRYFNAIQATPEYVAAQAHGIPLIPTTAIFPLETTLYYPSNVTGNAIVNPSGHLAVLPLLEYMQSYFADLPQAQQPVVIGSSVRRASLMANASHEEAADDYYRYRVSADMTLHLETFPRIWEALKELPPQQRRLFLGLESGRDWGDIMLPFGAENTDGTQRQMAFTESFFNTFLPHYVQSLLTDSYRTHPQTTKSVMEHLAQTSVERQYDIKTVDLSREENLEILANTTDGNRRVFLARLPKVPVRLLPALTRSKIDITDLRSTLPGDQDPSLVVFAEQFPVRHGKFIVTRFSLGADIRQNPTIPLTPDNYEDNVHTFLHVDIPTSASPEDMRRYDARSFTTYDRAVGHLKIVTPSEEAMLSIRHTFPYQGGQQAERPPIAALLLPDYKVFDEPVALVEGWGEPPRDPVDDLEVATRLLWEHVSGSLFKTPIKGHVPPLSEKTLGEMQQFVSKHSELTTLLQEDENKWTRYFIQSTVLVMLFYSPHTLVKFLGETGLWNLFNTNGQPWENIVTRLNDQVALNDYHAAVLDLPITPRLPVEETEFLTGWELFANALSSTKQPLSARETLETLYNFINIGYNPTHD